MKISIHKWFLGAAMAGLYALSIGVQAADTPVAQPATPPVTVEAPDAPAAAQAPESPDAPAVESPDDNSQSSEDERHFNRGWAHRRHNGNDRVVIGGDATLEKGLQAETVVSVFGSSTSDGDVTDSVVSVFGDTRVTGSTKDAVAVLGSVYLNGHATGDVVATMGSVELGPQAEVDGDVVVVGGTLHRDPAAVIHGNVSNVLSMSIGSFEWLRPWAKHCLVFGRPLAIASGLGWAWGLAFGFLALYVLISILFKEPVDRCISTLETQPGKCVLAAVLVTFLAPVMFALLVITVIGIAFIPVAAAGLFLIGLFGKAVMLAWIGRGCLRLSGDGRVLHTAVAVLIGGLIVTALYLVPFVGFLLYKALGFMGLGVAMYALLLNVKQRRAEGGGPVPPLATAGATVSGGSASFSEAPSVDPMRAYEPFSARTTQDFTEAPQPAADSTASAGAGPASSSVPPPSSPPPSSQSAPFSSQSAPQSPPPMSPSAAVTYPRAGFGVRMGALFIDVILIGVLLGIIDSTKQAELIALATYGAVMWKLKSTTIGGIVFGLQVVRVDGRPIDWATATVRALSCFLSLVVAGLGFIWIAFDEGHQAWHDKIAGTAVVRVPKGVSLV